jgi:hypothetical protein
MNDLVDVATAIVVVAGILVLTRPGSQGPGLVTSIGNSFIGALGTATGGSPGYAS